MRRHIDHFEKPYGTALTSIEATYVVVRTTGGDLRLTSVYKPPNVKMDPNDLDVLTSDHQGPIVVAGDLNCKHPTWNSRLANPDGRLLRDYADRNGLVVIGPTEPTNSPDTLVGRPDVLDIALLKNVTAPCELFTIRDLSSNHDSSITAGMLRTTLPTLSLGEYSGLYLPKRSRA